MGSRLSGWTTRTTIRALGEGDDFPDWPATVTLTGNPKWWWRKELRERYEPAGHGSGCDVPTAEAGNTGRLTVGAGGVFLGVGLAAAAAGLGFHFLFNKPKEGPASAPAKARVDVTPLVGTQFGGMSVSGKF